MAQIIIKEGDATKTLQLDKDVISIGRDSKNEVVLGDSGVSDVHARIIKTIDGYVIVDLDSPDGIYFHDNKIKERKLEAGDEIKIGKATIIFEKGSETAEGKSSSAVPERQSGIPDGLSSSPDGLGSPQAAAEQSRKGEEQPSGDGQPSSGPGPVAQIIIKEGTSSKTIKLDKDSISIGRSSKNEAVLEDKGVSRVHAQIRKTPDGYVIVDLDSHNGIYFHDSRIKERKLEIGDEIKIGKATIIFGKELEKEKGKEKLEERPVSTSEAQIIIKEGDATKTLQLDKDVISIGRDKKNEVVLDDKGVSRSHAQIRKTPDGYVIVDLDSHNGIYFHDNRIKERKLEIGDEIEIGDAVIIFGKELVKEKPMVIYASSPAEEFISTPYRNIFALLSKAAIIILISGAILVYGYIKMKEGMNQKVNLVADGASFEQFSRPAMFPNGWQPLSDSTIKAIVTDREYQDGQHSLMIEKDNSKEFYTELTYNSIFRVPAKAKTNPSEIYNFGGWIKSDQFKKSLSGYKITWLDDEYQVIREDYSDFISSSNEWRYCKINTKPTLETEYLRVSCVVLGANAKVYFDNISLLQIYSDRVLPQIITDKLTLTNQSYKLTIAPSGIWRLQDTERLMHLKGELVFKPENTESRQSFYGLGKIVSHTQNENINLTNQIVHPGSLDVMDISMESYISPALGINYNFPSNLYNSLMAKHFSLVCSLPIGDVKYVRLLNTAGETIEKSLYEKISEKMITEMDLGLISNIAILKYSQPVDIVITRDSDMLYFAHSFQPSAVAPKDEKALPSSKTKNPLSFEIEFGLQSTIPGQTDWERILSKAEEAERNNNFGEAIKLYRLITSGSNKKPNDVPAVQDKLNALENKAKESVQNAFDSLSTARIMRDFSLYDKTLKMFQSIVNLYKDTEYSERAKNIIQTIKTETQQAKVSDDKQKSEKVMVVADGYLKEKQLNMALWLYQQIIQKYGETPAAQQAKQNIEKIKKELPSDNSQNK
ncbi:MAG: FHA domain-containing protein [Planctomycetota bacterium]